MIRNCPICHSDKKRLLYTKDFHTKDTIVDKYDVVICKQCGMAYADNIPTQKEYDDYYANMSKYEFNMTDGEPSQYFKEHAVKIVDYLDNYLEKDMAILDIGCSTGALLMELKSRGFDNIMGIDPSKTCVKHALKNGVCAKQGTILSKQTGKYDLIVLSAVLEHVVDLQEAIENVTSMLNEDGMVFIDVPDANMFNDYVFVPFQQFNSEHINYFTELDLDKIMLLFGYDCVDTDWIETKRTEKIIEPDIFSLYGKLQVESKPHLRAYIEECLNVEQSVIDKVKKIKGPVIVWGVGEHTRWLLPNLGEVIYFVDNDKNYIGKNINGISIVSPNNIKNSHTILVSSYAHQDEIVNQIKEMGLKNKVITLW